MIIPQLRILSLSSFTYYSVDDDDDLLDVDKRQINSTDQSILRLLELEDIFPDYDNVSNEEKLFMKSVTSMDYKSSVRVLVSLRSTLKYYHSNISTDVNQPMIIDGDSLLLEILCNYNIDNNKFGFQILPCVFLLENLINSFSTCGREIHIIFLDSLKNIWLNSNHLLLRSIVIAHLKRISINWRNKLDSMHTIINDSKQLIITQNLTRLYCIEFKHFQDNEFINYVQRLSPELYVIGDGVVNYPELNSNSIQNVNLAADTESRYVAMTLHLLLEKIQLARITELEFLNRKVTGFNISAPKSTLLKWKAIATVYPISLTETSSWSKLSEECFNKVAALVGDSNLRLSITAAALLPLVKESSNHELAKLILLQSFLLTLLPLSHRAHLFKFNSSVFANGLNEFSNSLLEVVSNLPQSIMSMPTVPVQTCLIDIFDGRLVYALASLQVSNNTPLLNDIWKLVLQSAGTQVSEFSPIGFNQLPKLELQPELSPEDVPSFDFAFASNFLTPPVKVKVAEKVVVAAKVVDDEDDWEAALDEADEKAVEIDEKTEDLATEFPLTADEQKELSNWKSGFIVEDTQFERKIATNESTMYHNSKYSAFMERFSKTYQGDSRFVPWEVILGILENEKSDKDKKSKSKKSDEPVLSKADKIRRDNALSKYTELLKKIDSDLKHVDESYNDSEIAQQYVIDRLLVNLPKEMSKLKTLMAPLGANGLTPQEEAVPSLKYVSKLIELSYSAWMKLLQDLTSDPSAASHAAAAIAILSGQTPPTAPDFTGAFPQPMFIPQLAEKSDKPLKNDKKEKEKEKKKKTVKEDSDEDSEDEDSSDKALKKSKRKAGASKASDLVAAAAAADSTTLNSSVMVSASLAKRGKNLNPMDLASRLFYYISYAWRKYRETATIEQIIHWLNYLQWLGFVNVAQELILDIRQNVVSSGKKEKNSKTPGLDDSISKQRGTALFNIIDRSALKKDKGAVIVAPNGPLHPLDPCRFSFSRFQFQCGGYRLPRNVGSIPDNRTAKFGFWPDKWQWELLNIVDNRESALVIAPTSAGKSFISYYVIEKVLEDNKKINKQSEHGIVVVVLPTKALVNQVSAVIYQKYGDIFGIYSEAGYKVKVLQCQVLITLPTQFESLLVCASTYDWAKQIQYAIFDEVHCIGDAIEGVNWEHSLTLLPAPFVALSATVGNRTQFHDYLKSLQARHNRDVHLVTYDQRWSDLQYFMYLPSKEADDKWNSAYSFELLNYRRSLLKSLIQIDVSILDSITSTTSSLVRLFEASAPRGLYCEHLITFFKEFEPVHNSPLYKFLIRRLETSLFRFATPELLSQIIAEFTHNESLITTATQLLDKNATLLPVDLLTNVPTKDGVWARQNALGPANLVPVHPCAAISLANAWDPSRGFPGDLPFSANDIVQLHDMMKKVTQTMPEIQVELDAASPESLFGDSFLSKKDVKSMKDKLQSILCNWSYSSDPILQDASKTVFADFETQINSRVGDIPSEFASMKRKNLESRFFSMLCELNATDKLPAIVFNFENILCDHLCRTVVETLEYLEKNQHSAEIDPILEKSKQKLFDKHSKSLKEKRDDKVNEKEAEEERRAAMMLGEEVNNQLSNPNDNDIDERFSFLLAKDRMSESDLKWWLDRVHKKVPQWGKDHILIRALKRGVGVHREGLPKPYKDLVECLFRGKHLRIIMSTGTLAFGVNMPCRSTVFAMDSPSLTPLMFRQMSGRAGRRGYDDVGNVVFFGLPHWRVSHLMTTHLPSLRGQYPISNTFISRALVFYKQVGEKPGTLLVSAVRHLLEKPLASFTFDDDTSKLYSQTLLAHFQYSLHQLVKHHYLSANGDLMPFISLVTALNELDPFNLCFISLLSSGTLRKLCVDGENLASISKNLLLLVCHLLTPVPLAAIYSTADIPKSASKVIIDDLPEYVDKVVSDFQSDSLVTYVKMCKTLIKKVGVTENSLPLSKCLWPSKSIEHGELLDTALKYEARSPFVALCGTGDNFTSPRDLVDTCHSSVNLPYRVIPNSQFHTFRGVTLRKNAFALDFLKHQQLLTLMNANSMKKVTVWKSLTGLSNILENLVSYFTQLSNNPKTDSIVKVITLLSSDYSKTLSSSAWSDI